MVKEKNQIITDDTEESAEESAEEKPVEKPVKKPPQKAANTKKTLPSANLTNTPVAMVDPITFDDNGHSKNASTNKSKVANHNEVAENTLVLRPLSPRNKESFGNSLMKVYLHNLCAHTCVYVRTHTHVRAHRHLHRLTHTHTHTHHVHVHTHTQTYTHTHTHTCTHKHKHIYTHRV